MPNKNLKSIFADDPEVIRLLEQKETSDLLSNLVELERLRTLTEYKKEKSIEGIELLKGEPGEDGHTPTNEELTELILPLIPEPVPGIDGTSPTKEELLVLIRPLIPEVKDGETPSDERLASLIKPLIPEPVPGKDAEIPDLIKTIKDLKGAEATAFAKAVAGNIDVSWLRNANSFMFNGKRYKISELMHGGGSTTTSGLSVTTQYILNAVQAGSNVTIDLSQLTNFATFDSIITLYRNNVPQTEGSSYNFTVSGSTVTIFDADASEIFNCTYSFT